MKRALPFLVLATICAECGVSRAAIVVTSNAVYDINGSIIAQDPQISSTPPFSVDSSVSKTDVFARVVNVAGDNAATAQGIFVDGSPLHTVTAETRFTQRVTNAGPAQEFFYDFVLTGPVLTTLASSNIGQAQRPRSSYLFEVLVNGSTRWESSAVLSSDFDDFSLLTFGTALGNSVSTFSDPSGLTGFQATFNDYDSSTALVPPGLSLGTFGPGETFEFQTFLKVDIVSFGFEAGGNASVGDPGSIDGVSGEITTRPIGVIPEPAAMHVWFGLCLVVIAGGAALPCFKRRTGHRWSVP